MMTKLVADFVRYGWVVSAFEYAAKARRASAFASRQPALASVGRFGGGSGGGVAPALAASALLAVELDEAGTDGGLDADDLVQLEWRNVRRGGALSGLAVWRHGVPVGGAARWRIRSRADDPRSSISVDGAGWLVTRVSFDSERWKYSRFATVRVLRQCVVVPRQDRFNPAPPAPGAPRPAAAARGGGSAAALYS
jgi:hypothetical protein